MIWRDTRLQKPGFYFFRELPSSPPEVAQVFAVHQGMREPRYGWSDPPPSQAPFLLAKLMHDAEPVEADALCGEFLCHDNGEPVNLGQQEAEGAKQVLYSDEAASIFEVGSILGIDAEHGLLDVLGELETSARFRGWKPADGGLAQWIAQRLVKDDHRPKEKPAQEAAPAKEGKAK